MSKSAPLKNIQSVIERSKRLTFYITTPKRLSNEKTKELRRELKKQGFKIQRVTQKRNKGKIVENHLRITNT